MQSTAFCMNVETRVHIYSKIMFLEGLRDEVSKYCYSCRGFISDKNYTINKSDLYFQKGESMGLIQLSTLLVQVK
jgi:hypothetical protein